VTTREQRLSAFITDRDPPSDLAVQVLCEDHIGTYALPFLCKRDGQSWCNSKTDEVILADVIGWRAHADGP
jgi:hypothetical protein